jgi:hypothetical protein
MSKSALLFLVQCVDVGAHVTSGLRNTSRVCSTGEGCGCVWEGLPGVGGSAYTDGVLAQESQASEGISFAQIEHGDLLFSMIRADLIPWEESWRFVWADGNGVELPRL